MEREQELENHPQRALLAQQVFRQMKERSSRCLRLREPSATMTACTRESFRSPSSLSITIGVLSAFGLESEQPDYDMDSEDGVVLNPVKWKMAMKKRRK
nr:enhancer of polycomb homolog 2-like [Paramormyrops kingsleyae]